MAGLDVSVRGGERFAVVSGRLKRAMRDDLERELKKALVKAAKPMTKTVREQLPIFLPDRYALGHLGPTLKMRARASAALGVRISATATGKKDQRALPTIERGTLRHPVFGNYQSPWVNQRVRPGFFTKPLMDSADIPRKEMLAAMDHVLAQVANG